jgi:hypothetical protein
MPRLHKSERCFCGSGDYENSRKPRFFSLALDVYLQHGSVVENEVPLEIDL